MQIIVDNKIPYIKGVLEPYFEIKYLSAKQITREEVKNCDGLITRTRTICDKSLLEGSNIKIIASATIGLDHIDLDYCRSTSIDVFNSAGCNATAVVQYVLSIMALSNLNPQKHTIGIIGYGNIGSLLAQKCREFGFRLLVTDPFKDTGNEGCNLDYLLKNSDLITLHVPLTKEGEYKTENLADNNFFDIIKKGAIFINTSRGEVVCEQSLIRAIDNNITSITAIDVWHNEPNINSELLEKTTFSTTHIAGYSRLGKERATEMVVKAIAQKFQIDPLLDWRISELMKKSNLSWQAVIDIMPQYFDITEETKLLKSNIDSFEIIRENYHFREEF